ncbi:FadR/GntR family transcriptional regulator [Mobilicoccus caccae]|nr:FadR/GntR family transcriptional regulator [Mobilicoccus caccae]
MSADTRGDLHQHVLDALGLDITAGRLAPGQVLSIDALSEQLEVSRSVVREAIRVLTSMGLVQSRRRVGTVVRAASGWSLFDPTLIRWRLAGRDRLDQLHALTELREAVEPMAARLAAERADGQDRSELVALAARLWEAGMSGEPERFLEIDVEFHDALLRASGNPMFAQLGSTVTEILAGRTRHGLVPAIPQQAALQDHVDVATAIQRGDADAASDAMNRIVRRSNEEMDELFREGDPEPTEPTDAPTPGTASSATELPGDDRPLD